MERQFFRAALCAAVFALGNATPTTTFAQTKSEGYQFLQAVKERDGTVVTEALNQPGSVLVNTRDRRSGETAMHIVTQRRDHVWIKFLSQKGANPDIADSNGVTPLQIAASLGFLEGVEALLDAGASVDVTNNAGETPLISAVHRRDVAMIRMLLENGANPDHNDSSGRSARDYAQLMGGRSQVLDAIAEADEAREAKGNAKTYGPSF